MRLIRRFVILLALPMASWAQNTTTTTTTTETSEKKIEGEAGILTNYIWHGLTQTKRNPAIQSSLYYHLGPNFRLGAWGSNVSYYGRDKANALLKLQADIELKFTPTFTMGIHYSDNHYFESWDHDGNTLGFDFDVSGYKILIEQESNWQGTVTGSRYFAVSRVWDVLTRWKWENHIGYTQFVKLWAHDYFDFMTAMGTNTGQVFWQIGLTFTDDNAQFGNYADYFIFLAAKARF